MLNKLSVVALASLMIASSAFGAGSLKDSVKDIYNKTRTVLSHPLVQTTAGAVTLYYALIQKDVAATVLAELRNNCLSGVWAKLKEKPFRTEFVVTVAASLKGAQWLRNGLNGLAA